MNIFWLVYRDLTLGSHYLDDKRLIKQILESAQMLSTARHIWHEEGRKEAPSNIYKPTHRKHPCTLWTAETLATYQMHYEYWIEAGEEYSRRFWKVHKSMDLADTLRVCKKEAGKERVTLPPQVFDKTIFTATNSYFIDTLNVVKLYRDYISIKWRNQKKPPKWTNRGEPPWNR